MTDRLTTPDPHGRNMQWSMYAIEFDSPDGSFGFNIYAISDDHAELQLQAIKETARVAGKTVAFIGDEHD